MPARPAHPQRVICDIFVTNASSNIPAKNGSISDANVHGWRKKDQLFGGGALAKDGIAPSAGRFPQAPDGE